MVSISDISRAGNWTTARVSWLCLQKCGWEHLLILTVVGCITSINKGSGEDGEGIRTMTLVLNIGESVRCCPVILGLGWKNSVICRWEVSRMGWRVALGLRKGVGGNQYCGASFVCIRRLYFFTWVSSRKEMIWRRYYVVFKIRLELKSHSMEPLADIIPGNGSGITIKKTRQWSIR